MGSLFHTVIDSNITSSTHIDDDVLDECGHKSHQTTVCRLGHKSHPTTGPIQKYTLFQCSLFVKIIIMITLKIIITNIKCSLSAWPQISSDNRSNTYTYAHYQCSLFVKIIIMTTLKIIIINIKSSLSALQQISSDNRPEVENNGTIRRVAGWDSQSPSPYPFMAVARSKPYTLFYVL